MAKNESNATETNKPRVHGVSLAGQILTGLVTVGALGLPFIGIGGGITMGIIGGVALLSFVGFSVFRHNKRKAEKMGLAKTKVKAKKEEKVKTEEETKKRSEDLKNREEALRKKTDDEIYTITVKPEPKPVEDYFDSPKQSALEKYRDKTYKENAPLPKKSFVVYEANGETLKKDEHGHLMVYRIENNSDYRSKLVDYMSSETSGNCVIEVLDIRGKSERFRVPATNYRGVMGSIIDKIGEVSRQMIVPKESHVMEA